MLLTIYSLIASYDATCFDSTAREISPSFTDINPSCLAASRTVPKYFVAPPKSDGSNNSLKSLSCIDRLFTAWQSAYTLSGIAEVFILSSNILLHPFNQVFFNNRAINYR